ncbi:TPA: hypothetical protein LA827_002894 [Clostridium botulinum]|uniref:Uncharacterized protein n=1 Tax=Clostridium botulinum TaxID=1491 RepID=A0A126JIH9_CLOBO|nr:hypothetical protein [Clostridium botulinum]ALT05605.1 hypothetical protein [Clostridium botulinum]ALT05705.1 hypothetical protein [Clostridium botulinum]ALT05807.1 hypothetical protein [Clostridium botulinum]HBJ2623108.1 hypothetical protein [Clostridium botulinum]
MANNKARSIYLDLSEKTLEKYEQESNKSGLITRLLEEHYDANIVKVKIDSKIKDAYDNDIFKEFRIPMLLLEFYMRGNIEESKKEISISSNNTNINEEVISATSSEKLNLKKQINNSKDVIKEDNNKDVIKEDNTNQETYQHKPSDNSNNIKEDTIIDNEVSDIKKLENKQINDLLSVTKVFVAKNECLKENKSVDQHNKEIPKKVHSNNIKEDTISDKSIYDSKVPRSGSINDLLKGSKTLKNKKSIL